MSSENISWFREKFFTNLIMPIYTCRNNSIFLAVPPTKPSKSTPKSQPSKYPNQIPPNSIFARDAHTPNSTHAPCFPISTTSDSNFCAIPLFCPCFYMQISIQVLQNVASSMNLCVQMNTQKTISLLILNFLSFFFTHFH